MVDMWGVLCVETMWSQQTWSRVRAVTSVTVAGIIRAVYTSNTQHYLALVLNN